jgi:hypothetical protein
MLMLGTERLSRRVTTQANSIINHHFLSRWIACIGLAFISFTSIAETFAIVESKPISELWLNAGFYSHHFQQDKGFNNHNYGLGGEYRYSTVSSITIGEFYNSVRQTTHYAGLYWRPLELGPVHLGAAIGAMDGYPKMQNSGWFFAVIPTASIECKNIGAYLMYIPSYQDKLYGVLSLQLRIKVF